MCCLLQDEFGNGGRTLSVLSEALTHYDKKKLSTLKIWKLSVDFVLTQVLGERGEAFVSLGLSRR